MSPLLLLVVCQKGELSKEMKMEVRILSTRKQRLQTKDKIEEQREQREKKKRKGKRRKEDRMKSSYNV